MVPYKLFLDICHFCILREKIGHIISCTGKIAFFSKICVFNNDFVLQKWSFNFYIIIRKRVRPLQIVPRGLSHSIIWEKNAKSFCHCWDRLFWKVWISTSYVLRNDHIACTKPVTLPSGPLWIVPWHFSCSILREIIGQFFSFGKVAFFLQPHSS